MNAKQTWTCLYVLLFVIVQERCDACDWMMSQYRLKSSFCLSLLRDLGGEITFLENGPFPHLAYSEVEKAKTEDQVRFLAEATEQIVGLFSAVPRAVEVKWDSRILDDFLNILSSRQLKELKQCTATYAEEARRSSTEIKLRRHFKKLRKILKKANYSEVALEQVRNVVHHHLMRMDIIAANVSKKLMKRTNP